MDVVFFLASWREEKGLGVWGKGAKRFARGEPWRIYFIFWFKWGSENEVEKSVEKVVPKGPQMDPKSRPKSIERVFWRGLKKGPQKWTLSRIRKSEILPLFTTL